MTEDDDTTSLATLDLEPPKKVRSNTPVASDGNDLDLASITGRTRLPLELRGASGMKKLDWILGQPDPTEFVQALAPQELYHWIKDIGKGDAYQLLELADREQLRSLVDIDAWSRHELLLPRWLEWLDLAQAVGDDTAVEFIASQDDETLEWLFTGDVVVHAADYDLDFVPDDLAAFHTPDGMYLVTVPRDHDLEERLPRIMKLLWAADEDRARTLLQQVQFELRSNISADMERFRDARVQDLGFEPVIEALEVYADVPAKAMRDAFRKGVATTGAEGYADALRGTVDTTGLVQDLVLRGVEAPELLGAAIAGLDPAQRARTGEGLAYLVNKLFVADTGDLSRTDDLPVAARHAASVTNLGLEYASDESLEQATRILQTTSAETLFRIGHTLTVELGRVAHSVHKRAGAHLALSLFGTPGDEAIYGASQLRPSYFEGLDAPEQVGYRPFRTLADLARVEVRVRDGLAILDFFEKRFGFSPDAMLKLGVSADQLRRVRFATLFRTAIAWALLEDEAAFRPLGADDITAFARAAFVKDGRLVVLSSTLKKVLAGFAASDPASAGDAPPIHEAVKSFVARALDELVDTIGGVRVDDDGVDTRFTGDLFLVREA